MKKNKKYMQKYKNIIIIQSLYSISLNKATKFDDSYLKENLPQIIKTDIDRTIKRLEKLERLERKINRRILDYVIDQFSNWPVIENRMQLFNSGNINELRANYQIIENNEDNEDNEDNEYNEECMFAAD